MDANLLKHTLQDGVTLFVVIDPIGLVPLFIAITAEKSSSDRFRLALLSVVISAGILVGFIVGGQILLEMLEIQLSAFRVAGGLLLLIVGLQMVLGQAFKSEAEEAMSEYSNQLAVFPLAMPLIAGPGSIMTVVLLTDNARFSWVEQASTTAALMGVLALTFLLLIGSDLIQKLLGKMGVNVVTRILGLLLSALALETILTGIRDFFGLAG